MAATGEGSGALFEARAELRRSLIAVSLVGMSLLGIAVVLVAEWATWKDRVSLLGVALTFCPAGLWLVVRRWPRLGAASILADCCAGAALLAIWIPSSAAPALLILPGLMASLLFSPNLGLALALGASALVVRLYTGPGPADIASLFALLVAQWAVQGLAWLVLHVSEDMLRWSWWHYEQNAVLLSEARDQRVTLKQTQEDLIQANRELARLSDRLDALRQMAEEARRAKEEFVANVSHELRTPLNMIIGFSEMIVQNPQVYGESVSPTLLADIAVIQRNSQHLASLVDDVLDLSAVESSRVSLHQGWVSLADIVAEAQEAVRPLYESKGLTLGVEAPADMPPLYCDGTRIRQVILNLLSNAGRFTEEGGVTLAVHDEGQTVTVSVADTGPGLSAADQERVFEPFRQAGDSILRRHGGTGLGLSISRAFVQRHGGRMWLESEPGHGATFFFSLPRHTMPPSAAPSAARWFSPYGTYEARPRRSLAEAPTLRPRFVILEEGGALERLLRSYASNVEVAHVADQAGALAELRRAPAQALLVNRPPCDERVADWVQAVPYNTPVMLCHVPGRDEAAQRLGVRRYLVKPVVREQLLSALAELGEGVQTVLLVEDNQEAMQLFARMLNGSDRGYRVLRALTGQRALALMHERHPDAVLLDLVMPEMDGYAVLQEQGRDPGIRDIPVIAVSAQDPLQGPVGSEALTVSRGGGLCQRELLQCILGLSDILINPSSPEPAAPPENALG